MKFQLKYHTKTSRLGMILCCSLFIVAISSFILLAIPFFRKDKADLYEDDHTTWVYPPWKHTWGVVRATQVHLTFFTLGKATFINPQGLAVVRLVKTDDPNKTSDDDEVTVYGVNNGENSLIYNKSMTSIGLYGYDEKGAARLNSPWDVTATVDGLVFVTDSGNHRIVKLRNRNGILTYEGDFGARGIVQLKLPRGIEVTKGGKVLAADAELGQVFLFDTSGVFLNVISGFDRPTGLAAVDKSDPWSRPSEEYFVVVDQGGRRLSKVDFTGKIIRQTDLVKDVGLNNPYVGHLDIDIYHDIIATDSANAVILKFDPSLKLLSQWGQRGKGRTRFGGPTGICIWRRFGQTFIAEQNGAHYLWVGTDLISEPKLTMESEGKSLTLEIGFTERTRLEMKILDGKGDMIRQHQITRAAGMQQITWYLSQEKERWRTLSRMADKSKIPQPLPPGCYHLLLSLKPTYSSSRVLERIVETEFVISPL